MTAEEKVIQKIRTLLFADTNIAVYTQSHIYASHISSIEEPKYPAISLFLLRSNEVFSTPGMVDMDIQVDCWLQANQYDLSDVMAIHERLRTNLQRKNLIDTTIGVYVAQCVEIGAGPLLHEADTNLYHYPVNYKVVAR